MSMPAKEPHSPQPDCTTCKWLDVQRYKEALETGLRTEYALALAAHKQRHHPEGWQQGLT